MRITLLALALLTVVVVGACMPPSGAVNPIAGTVKFRPDAAGLAVDPVGKRIDFGRAPKGVIPVLDRELGRHRNLPVAGCPSGILQQKAWGKLVLSFSRERFVGWRNDTGQAGRICG